MQLTYDASYRGQLPGEEARSSLTAGPASTSASGSFLAYTPTSTLAITANSLTPQSVTGSVAGPLALTPVRRMDLPHEGMPCTPYHAFYCQATPGCAVLELKCLGYMEVQAAQTAKQQTGCFECIEMPDNMHEL